MRSSLHIETATGGGFADPVMDAQVTFRAVMQALAEPGTLQTLPETTLAALEPPSGLSRGAAAILLALADFETPVHLGENTRDIAAYLRFHAGCPIVDEPAKSSFAHVADGAALDDLTRYALGTLEYPDRSTTLVIEVESLTEGLALTLAGPGIATTRTIRLAPIHPNLAGQLADNNALFPQGVDLLFTDGRAVIGLPRSTRVTPEMEG